MYAKAVALLPVYFSRAVGSHFFLRLYNSLIINSVTVSVCSYEVTVYKINTVSVL